MGSRVDASRAEGAAVTEPTPSETSAGSPVAPAAPATAAPATASAAPAPAPLPKGMTVLVIGDSFAEALGAGLRTKEQETGIRFLLKGEKATYIPEWAGPNRGVAGLMIQYKPDLVVIALGGNELAMTTPEIRAPKVKKLVELLGTTPCVWVAPPLWGIKDNGLLGIIKDSSQPCRYFDSNVLSPNLPRGGDKIHPTAEGQKLWAGHFLDWLKTERDPKSEKLGLLPRPAGE
jgi:lysophospholipase L1-like esterase